MVLRQGDDDFKALYVVKNFNPLKEDGQQWDCSEYYGSNAYGGEMNFAPLMMHLYMNALV